MVCEKCDKWKEGASDTNESGGRKINENRWTPLGIQSARSASNKCTRTGKYCHTCAYIKGVCAMCGKQVLDTKFYKQSNV